MRRLVSTIIFLVGITLFTFFVIVFTTEHTNIISHLYKDKIVKTVENENISNLLPWLDWSYEYNKNLFSNKV